MKRIFSVVVIMMLSMVLMSASAEPCVFSNTSHIPCSGILDANFPDFEVDYLTNEDVYYNVACSSDLQLKRVTFVSDGIIIDSYEPPCAFQWYYGSISLPAGDHTVSVSMTDVNGKMHAKTWTVHVEEPTDIVGVGNGMEKTANDDWSESLVATESMDYGAPIICGIPDSRHLRESRARKIVQLHQCRLLFID